MVTDQLERRDGEPELSRDLGVYAVFTTATGTMIGAGIFILPGIAAEGAGPGAAISFLLAGGIAALAALSVCELATAMPQAGGPYFFVSRAMGALLGAIVGLGAWLALIFKGAFALVGLGQYVFHFSPIPILLTAVVGGILLALINLVGAKASGLFQNVVVVLLLAILGIFVGKGLLSVERELLQPFVPFGWSAVITTTGVVFISYLGIVKAAAVAEEVRDPGRNLPLGILLSVVLVTLLYVGTMVIVTGVLPIPEIRAATAPLADAGVVFLGAVGGVLVGIAGILATLSTGNAAILSSSRYPFAMARDALMTSWISRIHPRFRTPSRSILMTGGIMILLVLLLDVEGLAKLGGVFGMIVFALVNLSVIQLRWANPEWYRPSFRVPFFPVLPLVGAAVALAPIVQLDRFSQGAAALFVAAGVGWYFWSRRMSERTGKTIQPEYGLVDKLREIHQVQALAEKRRAMGEAPAEPLEPTEVPNVVVELQAGMPNNHLLALAAALARRYDCGVDALVVTEVPYQSPLSGFVAPHAERWLAKARARAEAYGVPLHLHSVRARERAQAILGFARPGTRALLLDWHEEFHRLRVRGSYMDTVFRTSPVRVAVLKYRGHTKYDRILVATAGSPYATAEVEMADALARLTQARLTLLMVLPVDASSGREEQAWSYLATLDELTEAQTDTVVARGDDVVEEILAAGAGHDLIVLGATREPQLRHVFTGHLVGPIADEIAERSSGSVLVTRDPWPARRFSARVGRWFQGVRAALEGHPRRPGSDEPQRISRRPEKPEAEAGERR